MKLTQCDGNGVEVLCGIAHIVDNSNMKLSMCVEVLGHSIPTQIEVSIPMPTSIDNVPTYISSIMVSTTQNGNAINVSNGVFY